MYEIITLTSLIALTSIASDQQCEESGRVISWRGDINQSFVDCIKRAAPSDTRIKKLIIRSSGGDAHFGLLFYELGYRVRILVVESTCNSSCANYLAPLAERVEFRSGAVMILHGGAQGADRIDEKDLRSLFDEGTLPHWEIKQQVAALNAEIADLAEREARFEHSLGICREWLRPQEVVPPHLLKVTLGVAPSRKRISDCLSASVKGKNNAVSTSQIYHWGLQNVQKPK